MNRVIAQITRRHLVALLLAAISVIGAVVLAMPASAEAAAVAEAGAGASEESVSPLIMTALYLGMLSLLPFAIMTLTSFLRIVVVLSFLRSGLGAQNVPPNMVIIGLSLFLTLFVMGPTLEKVIDEAVVPMRDGQIEAEEAFDIATDELKGFMAAQLGESADKEAKTLCGVAHQDDDAEAKECYETFTSGNAAEAETTVLIPVFITSELKKAFIMGFAVLLPFLVIDMVIANVLLSLGMFMLPPVVISLPFKILLFVLAGGWGLVVEFLVGGFII